MKTITRSDRSYPLYISVLALIAALLIVTLPQRSFALSIQYLQPEMRQYQQYQQSRTSGGFGIQTSASGTISGTSSARSAVSGTYVEQLRNTVLESLGIAHDVFLSSDGHFNISLPGISESLNFMTSGPAVNYSYNVPFSLSFTAPKEVTAGERVYLNPTLTWGDPLLQASQSLTYITSQSLSLDIPYDGISPLDIGLWQTADRLNVGASIPLGPFLGTYSDSFTFDSNSPWPLNDFGDGEASFFGVTNKFGGTGSIDTSGGIKAYVGDTDITVSAAPGTLTDAWWSGGDQLAFMGAIPAVGPVLVGLSAVFDLEHTIDIDIRRQDRAYFQLESLPHFDVPDNYTGGEYFPFVHMNYNGMIFSDFDYLISTKMYIDGPGFDPQYFLDIPLGSIYVGQISSGGFTGDSTFPLGFPVSVVGGSVSNLGHEFTQLINTYREPFDHVTPPGYTPVTPSDTNVSVPEPSTLLLLGYGMAGFAAMRVRKSGKKG